MLAEAFCASDERVRRIQSELDDAQACRTRTLAAFAVTVGNDGSIADVMGLNEREVRVARRTVGKEDARSLAADLLRKSPEPPAPQPEDPSAVAPEGVTMPAQRSESAFPESPAQPSAPGADATGTSHPEPGTAGAAAPGAATPGASATTGAYATTTASVHVSAPGGGHVPGGVPGHVPGPGEPVVWSPAMDSVLLWSWQSGIDLQAVAVELDLDVRALLQRVQALAAEGLLVLKPTHGDSGQAGRHRRHDDFFLSAPDSPEELYTHAGYVTQPY